MTIFDDLYCGSVAGQDADACRAWLQAGRDHRWAPPAPATLDWVGWVPALAAVVSVLALLLLVRATRKPAPEMPRPGAVAHQVTVADTTWHYRTVPTREARTEAHSVSPGW